MKKANKIALVAFAVICVCSVGLASLLGNAYYQNVLTNISIFAILGLSWNLLGGYAGVISFGHAAFFGIGAFTVTLLLSISNISPWIGLPAGMVLAAIAAVLIGFPTLRLRGVHFALAMLAYPIVLRYVLDWQRYQEVFLPRKTVEPWLYMQFDNSLVYTGIAAGLLFIALCICFAIENSRFGLTLLAIKQNEQAAEAAGIDVWKRKIVATAISGAIAGAAGGLYVVVIRVAVPADVFGLHISAQAMVVTLFGGVGTLWGPLIGATFLIPLGEILYSLAGHSIPGIHHIVYGIALVVVVLVAPEGIYWFARDRIVARRRTPQATTPGDWIGSSPSPAERSIGLTHPPERHGTALLTVEHLTKSFRGLKAVQDVTFTVREGIVFGVIGQNGAGKTSVFNLLNGFVAADEGRATFQGHNLIGLLPNHISRLGIGRTFQVARPFPRLSVLENVVVGAISTERDDAVATERAKSALATVGLLPRAHVLAGEINGLELRLLELARALSGRPKLLLLDEILAGLSHDEIERLLVVIRKLPDDGITVMIIEHTMHAMLRLCDELLVLDHGVVIASGPPADVVDDPKVVEAYLGKKWMSEHAAA